MEEKQEEPQLRSVAPEPKGVLQKNLKMFLWFGAALLLIVAVAFSSMSSKNNRPSGGPPQPLLMDNSDSNAETLKRLAPPPSSPVTEQPKQYVDPDYAPGGKYFGCVPGQPCTPQMRQENPGQLTPQEQLEQQLASKEKQLQFESRFTSNIAYVRQPDQPARAQAGSENPGSSLTAGRDATEGKEKRPTEVNFDSAKGPLYVLREGVTIDTILENRLDGDSVGPVKVMVSNPVYSHDGQNVLIPDGTVVLGEAKKIGAASFGHQRRMAVVFHRMLMPDGYSVDLDQFSGLDQTGEMGLRDKVNNHYLQIFGTSIALGVIAGAAEIEMGGGALSGSGSQEFTYGASSSVSQSATTILDRFIQIPPTITIREGHRVKIWLSQDMVLPAYQNHTIPGSF